jgi:hypothetical protein
MKRKASHAVAGFVFIAGCPVVLARQKESNGNGMMKDQWNKKEFLAFLRSCDPIDFKDDIDFAQLLEAFSENPEVFHRQWLQPLLAEGLNLDHACELALKSILRPN